MPSRLLKDRVLASAPRHTALLAEEAQLAAHAESSAISELRTECRELEAQEAQLTGRLGHLKRTSSRTHDILREIQQSKVARLMVRAKLGSRKAFERRVSNGEKDFSEAHQAENDAQEALRELQRAIRATSQRIADMESKAGKHVGILKSLESLYADLFEGDETYPEEQELRTATRQAERAAIMANLDRDRHEAVFGYLEQSRRAFQRAEERAYMALAVQHPGYSITRGDVDDSTKRYHLTIAADDCATALQSFKAAQEGCDAITELPQRDISSRTIFKNVLLELVNSDESMRKRIMAGCFQIHYALAHTLLAEQAQIGRLKAARNSAVTATAHAQTLKVELMAVRRRIVLDLAADAAPPAADNAVVDTLPGYQDRPELPRY